jgi:hypothetical protein
MEVYGKIVKLRAIEPEDLEMLRKIKNDPWMESMVGGMVNSNFKGAPIDVVP